MFIHSKAFCSSMELYHKSTCHFLGKLIVVLTWGILCLRAAECIEYEALSCRKHTALLTDFGGKGDGKTSNTEAFRKAIHELSKFATDGGAQLIVPPGKWLTGPFNLTSKFTLYIHQDAVLLVSQDEAEWDLIPPLPSYGIGRDNPGPRFISFIFGTNLTDVVITGGNGTIDGQGQLWWTKFRQGQMKNTRPYMIEIMFSDHVQISNLTLINSPSWNVHPIYSSFVIIKGLTILAPFHAPNTDGIDPDSCSNTRIEDCYIVSGDDCIAVKSGYDEYGIAFGMPTKHLIIRNLTCISPSSAVIALGSEMSGGIQDVRAENIGAIGSESGLRIKTAIGRGAYVKDVFVRGMTLQTMKYTFWITGDYGAHPDDHYDRKAIPVIQGINIKDTVANNVTIAGKLAGIDGDTFNGICISNVAIEMSQQANQLPWNCSNIKGVSSQVTPQPCALLPDKKIDCPFPTDTLPVDNIQFQTCAAATTMH
ncbi:probable polygalacturonase [Solanum pennellii]|uniref:Probable polygalacturonase n=1 Tax=Solanum pennellii TaxID=28526 RepID=A0ABM1GB60_SOLPN|nr:probable polygalacturonase [Solanum pennellii]